MPALMPDFEAGNIDCWHKAVGDPIAAGEVIADIETDKAVVELEATDSGILGKIIHDTGTSDVAVDEVIGLLLQDGETVADLVDFAVATGSEATSPAAQVILNASSPGQPANNQTAPGGDNRIFASPLARRIAQQLGVDLRTLKGRGPKGRILRADVEASSRLASEQPAAAQLPAAAQIVEPQQVIPQSGPQAVTGEAADEAYTAIPNSSMRKVIARRLSESKREIPHFYLTVDCELDALLALRRQYNAESPQGEGAYKLSVNDLLVKACALALRDVPAANVSWTEEEIRQYHQVNIGVAVATPGGLITPIVRRADRRSLTAISAEIKDLAARAQARKLKPAEYQGGGFTISNLGMFGIKHFSAIVNPPQSCILAVGAAEQRPVVKEGVLGIATVMSCTLAVDHRSVDGALGAEFLQAFKKYTEQPLSLLLRGTES